MCIFLSMPVKQSTDNRDFARKQLKTTTSERPKSPLGLIVSHVCFFFPFFYHFSASFFLYPVPFLFPLPCLHCYTYWYLSLSFNSIVKMVEKPIKNTITLLVSVLTHCHSASLNTYFSCHRKRLVAYAEPCAYSSPDHSKDPWKGSNSHHSVPCAEMSQAKGFTFGRDCY